MLPILPLHIELLKQIEQAGEDGHRFTNGVGLLVKHRFVNSYLHHVVINDWGRSFLRGLITCARVEVQPSHKHYDRLKGKVGTIQSIIFTEGHPKDIFPIPDERKTMGWEAEQRLLPKVKGDSPVFLVIFDNEPWAQWCFYNVNDLAISG
jgi:hypothetical protein